MNNFYKVSGKILFWLCWPALFMYLRGSTRCRIVVIKGNKIMLLQNWLSPGDYGLPGGGLKNKEDLFAAAARELKEETGLIAIREQLHLLHPKFLAIENGLTYSCIGLFLEVKDDQQISRQKFEIANVEWVKLGNILTMDRLNPTTRYLITTWLEDKHLLD